MIDFTTPNDVKEVISSLKKFVKKEIEPLYIKHQKSLSNERFLYDETGKYVKEIQTSLKAIRKKSAEAGFYSMFGPAELGGTGDVFGPISVALIYEELYKLYGHNLFIEEIFPPGLFVGGLTPVLLGLNSEVRNDLLPSIKNGDTTLCFALSEPSAGSDVWNLKTKATKAGDYWFINGSKQWITNAPYADYAMVFAVTDQELVDQRKGGITCFLVPFDNKTCKATSVIPYLGHLGSKIGIVTLDNVKVHESQIIGQLHEGFGKALHGVDIGRVVMSAKCVGLAQWALRKAVDYSKERETFGVTIDNHQMIQMMIAESATEIYAARNMLLHCVWKMEKDNKLPVKEISMIKAYCTEMAQKVIDRCMQIHGGMGLTNELKLEAAWRWARSMRIPDGTSEIQKRTVARRILKGDIDFA